MMSSSWEERFRVRSYEASPDSRLRVSSLCDYLQEAAANHAHALGVANDQLVERGAAWVLARLYVVVDTLPFVRSNVTVHTWPSGVDRLYALRDFDVCDEDGKSFARAISGWLLIDVHRKRPMRMPTYVTEIEPPSRPRSLGGSFPRHEEQELDPAGRVLEVPHSAIDLNRHTNNVRFIEWALDALPPERLERHTLQSLDIVFRSEAVQGDVVRSDYAAMDGDVLCTIHRISNVAGEKALASAVMSWLPIHSQRLGKT